MSLAVGHPGEAIEIDHVPGRPGEGIEVLSERRGRVVLQRGTGSINGAGYVLEARPTPSWKDSTIRTIVSSHSPWKQASVGSSS